jgi:acyl-[acyl-carrier-protein] desaturase
MLRKREDEVLNSRQVATNERSASARRSVDTERQLYRLYQSFFRQAEDERHWNVWQDIPWDQAPATAPSDALCEMALSQYRDALMLPDYAAVTLQILRSSRGRAWFVTRWSYDEGRHLLGLHEWLLRRAGVADADLKALAETQLSEYRWAPPFEDAEAVMVDALVWELTELEQLAGLRERAVAEGDMPLLRLIELVLADEAAHREFFREALALLAREDPEGIRDAVVRVAHSHESERLEADLVQYLGLA